MCRKDNPGLIFGVNLGNVDDFIASRPCGGQGNSREGHEAKFGKKPVKHGFYYIDRGLRLD